MVERLQRMGNIEGLPKVRVENPQQFFERLESTSHDLLTWTGELYFELHRGTYTSQAKTKLYNRQSEWLMRKTEFLSTLAYLFSPSQFNYPKQEIDRLWKLVLL